MKSIISIILASGLVSFVIIKYIDLMIDKNAVFVVISTVMIAVILTILLSLIIEKII